MNARWLALVVAVAVVPEVYAQQADTSMLVRPATTTTLSLAEAVAQARENSPTYRQVVNNADPANAAVRSAYGAFIPNVGASGGVNYSGAGSQFFGGQTFTQPSSYGSTYQLGFDWTLSGTTLFGPSAAKASRRAAEADVSQGGLSLAEQVITQYLNALQTQSTSEVARQQLRRNLDFLQLTTARQRVGQTSMYDVRQADVTANNSKVDLLRARQAEVDQKLELLRVMGVTMDVPMEQLALTDTFPVLEPDWELEDLVREAGEKNPGLQAERARADAARAVLKQAKSSYFPSLQLNGGWSGYTQQFSNVDQQVADAQTGAILGAQQCQDDNVIRGNVGLSTVPDCNAANGLDASGMQLQSSVTQSIVDANDVFPWSFTNNPFGVSLGISLPIFQGFSRGQRVSEARAQQRNADEQVRALELQLRTTVASRLQATKTTFDVIAVQRQSQEAAREQLALAQERYRLGSGTVLEVSDALNAVTAADAAYINAVSDHQRAIVALYAALGRNYR
jgi:outer membrane protein TolC